MSEEARAGERRVLARGAADLDGDGKPELVTVTGMPVSEGGFSRDMVMLIRNGATGRTARAVPPENEGYPPQLVFSNLTGGPGSDILLIIPTGGSGGIVNAYVYKYLRGAPILVFSTDAFDRDYQYTVTYLDGYRVKVESLENETTYIIDISLRGSEYLSQIYNPDGTLIKPVEGFVNPVSGVYPVDFDGDGVSSLLLFQEISGLYHADGLGYAQSVLTWVGTGFLLESQYVAVFGTPEED